LDGRENKTKQCGADRGYGNCCRLNDALKQNMGSWVESEKIARYDNF
jgi:hypothetical protein